MNFRMKIARANYWKGFALLTIASLMTVGAAAASPKSQSGGNENQTLATETIQDSNVAVNIDNFVFAPGNITVKAGTQVTWTNHDDIPHTVDSTDGKFKSPALDTDQQFQFRFTQAGEYPFFCRLHPKMTGKIIVQP